GVFRSRRAALAALRGLADEHGLCLQALGLERAQRRRGACFRHQIGRCAGVCAGRESAALHDARLSVALARLKTVSWPWRGPVGVVEDDRAREATDVHVVHNWCYLGTAACEAEIAEILKGGARPRFDLDQYKILARHLLQGRARVVELAAA
ncbi:MAG TPA: ethanolamine utilization protein, partial [Myxococcota bacterium]|nr:ethanolamine utilization protein [Myxococcota bacterium]